MGVSKQKQAFALLERKQEKQLIKQLLRQMENIILMIHKVLSHIRVRKHDLQGMV